MQRISTFCANLLLVLWVTPACAGNVFDGKTVYAKHCQHCHGETGEGVVFGAPNFMWGERLINPDSTLIRTVESGKGIMPAYRGLLKPRQIEDAVSYIRTLRK